MYTEQDLAIIRQRIKKYWAIALLGEVVIITAFVLCMIYRWEYPAYAAGIGIFAYFCAAWCMYLGPHIRYLGFLKDMNKGMGRTLEGRVVEIAEETELQDGVRVHPVRLLLSEEQDERIVYLNASKRELMPAAGTEVKLDCFGRHIREVAAV